MAQVGDCVKIRNSSEFNGYSGRLVMIDRRTTDSGVFSVKFPWGQTEHFREVDIETLWTTDENATFEGRTWTERRIVCVKGRYFADLMNIFNPAELRKAQTITEAEAARGIVGKVVYRDNEHHHTTYVSDEIADLLQGWTGIGWKK